MSILVRNALKINNIPDLACFTNFTDLLKALPQFFSVEIPQDITNVIISNAEPNESQRDSLWIKTDSSGSFVGLFLFTGGAWNQIYPAPNEIFWMYGDSTDIPPGYQLVDNSNPNFTTDEVTFLQQFFYPPVLGWDTFDPLTTANPPLSFAPTSTFAEISKLGSNATVQVNVAGTLSGTAAPDLVITLPFNFTSTSIGGPATVFIAGAEESGYWVASGSNTLIIRRNATANWPNSGTASFLLNFSYRTLEATPTSFSLFQVTRTQF